MHINNSYGPRLKAHPALLGHQRLSEGTGGSPMEINTGGCGAAVAVLLQALGPWPMSPNPWAPSGADRLGRPAGGALRWG